MCEHLIDLENYIKKLNIVETYRGKAWSDNCREWIYYDCYFNIEKIRLRFDFPKFIINHSNDDIRSGLEEGFVCSKCKDGIIGLNSRYNKDNNKITLK